MEVGNSIDVEISMAEQVDSDKDDDVFGNLDIPNLSQLLIPGTSSDVSHPTQTDGGQQLATQTSTDQSRAHDLQHLEDINRTRTDPMNPADYTSQHSLARFQQLRTRSTVV